MTANGFLNLYNPHLALPLDRFPFLITLLPLNPVVAYVPPELARIYSLQFLDT